MSSVDMTEKVGEGEICLSFFRDVLPLEESEEEELEEEEEDSLSLLLLLLLLTSLAFFFLCLRLEPPVSVLIRVSKPVSRVVFFFFFFFAASCQGAGAGAEDAPGCGMLCSVTAGIGAAGMHAPGIAAPRAVAAGTCCLPELPATWLLI
jgi:hypothetical protein